MQDVQSQSPFRDKRYGFMQLYLPFQNNKFDILNPKTFFTSLGVEKQQEASSPVHYSQCQLEIIDAVKVPLLCCKKVQQVEK